MAMEKKSLAGMKTAPATKSNAAKRETRNAVPPTPINKTSTTKAKVDTGKPAASKVVAALMFHPY